MTHRESYVPQRSFGTEIKSSPALNSIFSEESLLYASRTGPNNNACRRKRQAKVNMGEEAQAPCLPPHSLLSAWEDVKVS